MEIVGIKIAIGLSLKLSKFLTNTVECIFLLYQKAKFDDQEILSSMDYCHIFITIKMHWHQKVSFIKWSYFTERALIRDEPQQNSPLVFMVNWKVKLTEIIWAFSIYITQWYSDIIVPWFYKHSPSKE